MRLSEIQHQDRALAILHRALRSGRTHHAYLFDGPQGVGKQDTAFALAARLLCLDTTGEPDADACGECTSCRLLASDNHPDFHRIHRGLHKLHPDRTIRNSKGLYLVVDIIRHFLIEPAGMRPTQSPRRVFLIQDAERMNEGAQNALLKTLEEPPGDVCLLLVTASANRLLPTIRSRCQQIPFGLLPPDYVADQLQTRFEVPTADATALAGLAGGRLGVAAHWHQIDLLDTLNALAPHLDALPAGDIETFGKALVELATDLAGRVQEHANTNDAEDGDARKSSRTVGTDELRSALKLVFMLIAAVYRDAMILQSGADTLTYLAPLQARTRQMADTLPADQLDAAIRAVATAEIMLDRNVAAQLTCERLAIALLGDLPPASH